MLQLPNDLLAVLSTFLSNKERKTLRLTNHRLYALNSLHIRRVFISPSQKNIEVFRAIATHPVYCKQVKEIVWDDARFENYESDDDDECDGGDDDDEDSPTGELFEEGLMNKSNFQDLAGLNLSYVGGSEERFLQAKSRGIDYISAQPLSTGTIDKEACMSLDESWELYHRLYDEQEAIIAAGTDLEAFREGLAAFTSLERVTVTSEAYRPTIFTQCYPTPLIRSLPAGFNYPGPWPWMGEVTNETRREYSLEDIRKHWRGVTIVLAALAQSERLVPEFIIDTRYEQLGLAYQFFDRPSDDVRNLEILCQRGLRRLELAIHTFPNFSNPGLRELAHGQLRAILSQASHLENFSLHTSSGKHAARDRYRTVTEIMDALSALPLESWPRLKHLTLSYIPVIYSDLLEFLQRLPESIQSVTLINVGFTESTYKDFLERCRDDLRWTANRPRLAVAYQESGALEWRRLWAQEEIAQFFAGGPNPFDNTRSGNMFGKGFGTLKDDFDEEFSRSYAVDDPRY